MEIQELKNRLLKEKKSMLNECWNCHKNLIRATDGKIKREELESYLENISLIEWEDIGFFTGYVSALNNILDLLS